MSFADITKVNGTPALFVKLPIPVSVYQWWKVSDFCENEKRDVEYYRRPDVSGLSKCKHCDVIMHHHGWIDTLEGGHIVCPSDWIITGVRGEKYPCKDSIFKETYELYDEKKHANKN